MRPLSGVPYKKRTHENEFSFSTRPFSNNCIVIKNMLRYIMSEEPLNGLLNKHYTKDDTQTKTL